MKAAGISVNSRKVQPEYGTVNIGDLLLESGSVLPEVELAFERAGHRGAPVILVCHALTGNQYTVGTEDNPGWWSGLIGQENYIDSNHFDIITFNVLGGCNGSTGPQSINPETNRPYQFDFPKITIRDIVRAQYLALERLGIRKVKAILGGSLGGMQVLEWGLCYPGFSELIVPIAVTPFMSDYGIAFNAIGRNAIKMDPSWKAGFYSEEDRIRGLEVARMVGMITYRTGKMFDLRFNREQKVTESGKVQEFQVESYLNYQGQKLARRFDANSYLYLLDAMDSHDIGRERQGWKEAARGYEAEVLLLAFTGDLLYPPQAMKELYAVLSEQNKVVSYHEIMTDFGHDGFLAEFYKWGKLVQNALS